MKSLGFLQYFLFFKSCEKKCLLIYLIVGCVQTSPISFHPRKRDVCETASLIVFQYPAVFQEFVESAFIGCLTIATVRNNSDWLSSGNARDNVCLIVCCVSRLF